MKPESRANARPAFEERWRRRFMTFAAGEDDAAIAGWSQTGLQARLRHFASVWKGDAPGSLWLDAGCGAGTYSRYMASRGMTVLGLDYSLPTVIKARQRDSASCRWGAADVTRLPVKPGSCDGVLCFGVMQTLSGPAPALRELAASVRPGGQVWVDGLNGWCLPHLVEQFYRWLRQRPPHVRYQSPVMLRRLMRDCGLVEIRLHWLPIFPQRWQRFQGLLETRQGRWIFRYLPGIGAMFSHAVVLSGVRADHAG